MAVAEKVEQQREFVAWWEREVRGSGQPKKNSLRPALILSASDAEELTGIKHQQVSRWRKKLSNEEAYKIDLYGVAYRAAMGEEHNHRAQGTGENEWYTPEKYIEMARPAPVKLMIAVVIQRSFPVVRIAALVVIQEAANVIQTAAFLSENWWIAHILRQSSDFL